MKRFFLRFRKDKREGITLLEVIVVMAILAMLITTSVSSLAIYRDRQVLNGETSQILSVFSKARSETLASRSQLSYGVRINADRIILYPTTFASSTLGNEEYVLSSKVAITDMSINGGGLDVLFARLTGETASYGTIRITLLSDPTQYHTISITQTGFVGTQN